MDSFVLTMQKATTAKDIGGKARALLSLGRAGFLVPEWAVIIPDSWELWRDSAKRAALEGELLRDLANALPGVERFAVRSSGIDEDGAEHSFAGQLDSFLFVPREKLLEKISDVWASGFSDRIATYCKERQLPPPSSPPAVLVQRMIDADAAGVAFAADPVTGRRGVAVVSAVWGLGTALVGGSADADFFRVDRFKTIFERKIAEKKTAHRFSGETSEGVTDTAVPEDLICRASLSDSEVVAISELARAATRHFGRPQDIEWALKDGNVYLLQSRPITSLGNIADPDGALILWDNSNIAESYNGVTTPLTFSFARRVYEEVYRQFCLIMRVNEAKIANHAATFRSMLGLIRGRIYYNLLNWYRVLALLPGFQINRRFMEQMMGVKEGLPERILAEVAAQSSFRAKLCDSVDLIFSLAGLLSNLWGLQGKIEAFNQRLNDALRDPAVPLTEQRGDELAGHYLDLERQLLTRWDAPLINDFYAMIFYGALRRLCKKWCGDEDESLQNDLIAAEGGIISAEPARRLQEMGRLAAQSGLFAQLLTEGSLEEIQEHLVGQKEFTALYHAYLDKFGDRCIEELKLETATLYDEPLMLLRSIGQIARRSPDKTQSSFSIDERLKANALARVNLRLQGRPIRGFLFYWILRQARARVRERENLRFERTRLFGRVRRIFIEIGKRLEAVGRLDQARDIFYLTVEEILGFVDGTTVTTDLRSLVRVRREEFNEYRHGSAPGDRFETVGMVHQGNAFTSSGISSVPFSGDELRGIGCCPGVVRGRARVIFDPRQAEICEGEILVAPRTDPGWIMLFPSAAGLLVEYGSLLSHSAIVARELGLPAVVSISGVTAWIKTGDWVEMDGSTGSVRKIQEPVSA